MTGTECDLCGRPSGDDARVCTPCAQTCADALTLVRDHLAADLDTTLARQTSRPAGPSARSAETPLPVDLRALDAAHHLRTVLVGWVRVLAETGTARLPQDTLPAVAAWLLPMCGILRHADYGPDAVTEIRDAVNAALRAVDTPPQRAYVGPCECGEAVYARPGAPAATCRGCGAVWGVEEQREWLRAAAEDMLLTATEIARAVSRPTQSVTPSMVRGWANRRRLLAHGADAQGRPTYRVGDVLDLLAENAQAAKMAS